MENEKISRTQINADYQDNKKKYFCVFVMVMFFLLIGGCHTTQQFNNRILDANELKSIESGLLFNLLPDFQITASTNLLVRDLDISYLEVIKRDQAYFLAASLLFSGPSIFSYKTVDTKIVESHLSAFLKEMKFPEKMLKMLALIYLDVFEVYKKDDIIYQSFADNVLIQYKNQNKSKSQVITFDKENNTVISRVCLHRKKKLFQINYSDYRDFNGKLIPFRIEVDEFKYNVKLKIQIKDIKILENN